MPPKKNRADKKTVEKIFKEGRFINSPVLSFKFILNKKEGRNISFIVPKSTAKSAVKRNMLRRRGYAALRKYLPLLPSNLSGAFILKTPTATSADLDKEIKIVSGKL